MEVKIGDDVWVKDEANGRYLEPVKAKVEKVGVKFIHAGGKKFFKGTLRCNDNYGHHVLILSLDDYKKTQEKIALINKINLCRIPRTISYENAILIAEIIGIKN